MKQAMTVDVEDYFQVAAFDQLVKPEDWDSFSPRVERNTERLLDLFAEHDTKATFFTLGWVAQRFPRLIKRIVDEGHELASHGTMHQKASTQTPEQFKKDVGGAKQLLEDISGQQVLGYRAPSFSFTKENLWVYDVLAEEGYKYSSSVYPVVHDHYGIPDAPRFLYKTGSGIDEIPLSTLTIMRKNVPISGGGYFRLYPYFLSRWLINSFLSSNTEPYIFYMHPWEVDYQQPVMKGASWKSTFRHYLNLKKVESRLSSMLNDYEWTSLHSAFYQR